MHTDPHGNPVTGATPRALEAYAQALEAFLSWSGDARADARRAVEEAPGFTLGHVMHALLHIVGRDPSAIPAGAESFRRARALPQNEREGRYVDALATALTGDFDGTRARLR